MDLEINKYETAGDPILPLGAQVVETEACVGNMRSSSLGVGGGSRTQGAAPCRATLLPTSSSYPCNPLPSFPQRNPFPQLPSSSGSSLNFYKYKDFDKVFVIKSTNTNILFNQVCPIKLYQSLNDIVPGIKGNILRNGSIQIKTKSKEESVVIEKLTYLGDYRIDVEPHRQFNTCKGIVSWYPLINSDETTILDALSSQNVISVQRLNSRKNGPSKPSPALILTFNVPNLPERVNFGFNSVRVRPYIPNPKRCFNCWKIGHYSSRCASLPLCKICSEIMHDGECTSPPKCINCQGLHPSLSTSCNVYKKAVKIQELMTIQNLSFREASRRISPPPTTHQTYAETVAPATAAAPTLASSTIPSTLSDTSAGSTNKELLNAIALLTERIAKMETVFVGIMEQLNRGNKEIPSREMPFKEVSPNSLGLTLPPTKPEVLSTPTCSTQNPSREVTFKEDSSKQMELSIPSKPPLYAAIPSTSHMLDETSRITRQSLRRPLSATSSTSTSSTGQPRKGSKLLDTSQKGKGGSSKMEDSTRGKTKFKKTIR